MKKVILPLMCTYFSFAAVAQTDSVSSNLKSDTSMVNTFIGMDLESLMDVKIVSASKKSESLFDAPLSASSVSREEIKNAGATSIMEALRLVPGVIVRETTNGNYDVHIRGFADLPPGALLNSATNSTILVMIDNRPVYNYFSGGTFWETLPVDLNDVEKIEVIRGPSSALYGPNAATGVINIITRRATKDGLYSVANVQGGIPNTYLGNASAGYKKGKFDFIVSGNFQNRKRIEDNYYSWVTDKKGPIDSVKVAFPAGPLSDLDKKPNSADRYPNPTSAMEKYGYNAFINYAATEKIQLGLTVGGQQSQSLVAYTDNLGTPLTNRLSNSNYADFHTKIYGLTTQVSYQSGIQDVSKGHEGYKYNFNTVDALAEYDINFLKYFTVKPGVSYRSASYDDSKYTDISLNRGFINGSKTLDNYAGSFRAEFDNGKAIKLTAAARYDKYNHPTAGYLSYQFAGNFKINDKNLFRVVYSRSFRGPTIYDTYSSQSYFIGNGVVAGVTYPIFAARKGNDNLVLQQVNMFELGYRLKATDFLHFDLETFYQTSQNYNMSLSAATITEFNGPNPKIPSKALTSQSIENLRLKAEQVGFTLGANFIYKKLQFKPFVTIQQTFLYDVSKGRASATANKLTYFDGSNSSSPSYFGGAYLNFQATSKWNLNVSSYYYGKYSYTNIYNSLNTSTDKTKGIASISDKVMVNAKVSYKVFQRLDVFVNARNAFDAKAQEFANTDITQGIYMIGASLEY